MIRFPTIAEVGVLALCAVIAVASLIVTLAATADHRVQFYYVGEDVNGPHRGVQVMGSVNWLADDLVFATDDVAKAVDMTNRLNETLAGKRAA